MNAITTTPVPQDVMHKLILSALKANFVEGNTYEVYPEQGDTYDNLYASAWDANALTEDGLKTIFQDEFWERWYSEYEDDIVNDIGNSLEDAVMDYASDNNLPLGDIRQQLEEEKDNIRDELIFKYDDVIANIVRNFEYWLPNEEVIGDMETANALSEETSIIEAGNISKIVDVADFKQWFKDEYGIDGTNYNDDIDSFLQVADEEKRDTVDDDYDKGSQLALEALNNISSGELVDIFDEIGLDAEITRFGDRVAIWV